MRDRKTFIKGLDAHPRTWGNGGIVHLFMYAFARQIFPFVSDNLLLEPLCVNGVLLNFLEYR